MKQLSSALLAFSLSFSAIAQDTDPVAEQIRLTQDAVRISVAEIETSVSSRASGPDTAKKLQKIREESLVRLREFERSVVAILSPIQPLVQRYRLIHGDQSISAENKRLILNGLLDQIRGMAGARAGVYQNAIWSLMQQWGYPTPSIYHADRGDIIFKQCYSLNCFYETQTEIVIWASTVAANFAKPITIVLADGRSVQITHRRWRGEELVSDVELVLGSVSRDFPGAYIGQTLEVITPERFEVLESVRNFFTQNFRNQRSCKRGIAPLLQRLCRTTGGCILGGEKRVIGLGTTDEQKACLN